MADQFAPYDVLRVPCEGANLATTFTDQKSHAYTIVGTAALSTAAAAAFMHSTSSMYQAAPGTNYVQYGAHADWNLGSGNWAADFEVKPTALDSLTPLEITDGSTATLAVSLLLAGGVSVSGTCGGVAFSATAAAAGTALVGMITHLAVFRLDNAIKLAVNGTIVASATVSGAMAWSAITAVRWAGCTGYSRGLRLTKGHSRWTGPFTPPIDNLFNSLDAEGVTTTTLGPRTMQVSVSGCLNPDAVIAAVDEAVLALGWSAWDSVYRGTVTKVYRCLNLDGISYKYSIFFWDKTRFRLMHTSCEYWNPETHTATNECWSNHRSDGQMGWGVNNCDIILYGCSRYLGVMSYLNSSSGMWSFCVETEREAAEDTAAAGFPCWGMIYSSSFLVQTPGNASNFIRYPRTRDGAVGTLAAQNITQITSLGAFGGPFGLVNTKFGSLVTASNTLHRSLLHGWDSAKRVVTSLKAMKYPATTDSSYSVYGRLFGVKATGPIGNTMDKVTLPVDVNLFFDGAGTDCDHWLLPSHHMTSDTLAGAGSYVPSVQSWTLASNACNGMAFTGVCAYVGTNTAGLYKVNVTDGTKGAVAGTTGQILDVVFDGQYVYASTPSGIYRVDTATDAVTSLTVGVGGTRALVCTGKQFLYASQRTAATAPLIYKIDLASFTLVATITPSAKTTASTINALAHDGANMVAGAFCNATTAADTGILFVTVDGNGATWSAQPVPATYDMSGITWSGYAWLYGGASVASGMCYNWQATNNTATIAYSSTTAAFTPGTGIVAAPTSRVWLDHLGYMSVLAPASMATATGGIACSAGLPDGSGTTGWTNLGGTALGATGYGTRCLQLTGNAAFAIGQDNMLYMVTNLYQKSYNTTTPAMVLVPR